MIFVIVAAVLVLDQLTKFIISKSLVLNESFNVVSGIFSFTLVHNRGGAFGILKNQVPLFVITSIFSVILIFSELKNNKHKFTYRVALSLILAGALGNLIDRLAFGYVIDFMDFHIWPVFNVADSSISVGAVLLCLSLLKEKK